MSTFTGKTVNDAVQAGLKSLKTSRSAVKIDVIQTARKGFFGIGRRSAKVKLIKKQTGHQPSSQSSATRSDSQHYSSTENASAAPRPTRKFTIKQRRPNHFDHSHDNKTGRSMNRNQVAIKKLESYLGNIIRLLGISATMKAKFKNSKQIYIDFSTNKEGLLIGKHGLTINALQELSKVYLNRLGFYHLYVELDTANYRQRRMEILGRLSEQTAREAVATGKPVYLDPMPSFERKKIHKTLENSDHVTTYSAGREPYRAVVVAPK